MRVSTDPLRLVVPVPDGEAVWIGLSLPARTEPVSVSRAGRPVDLEQLGAQPDGSRFVRSAPFGLAGDSARVDVVLRGPGGEARMEVELVRLEAFNDRFGFDWRGAPPPTSYGGWLLP